MSERSASPRIQVVGNLATFVDEDVSGLAEAFNEFQCISLGDFATEVRHHITHQPALSARAFGGIREARSLWI